MPLPASHYVPQTGTTRRPAIMWLGATALTLSVVAIVVSAPIALRTGHPFLAGTIYRAFSYVCHQIPERSFFIAGHPLAICARCSGLYTGFTLGLLAYPLLRSLRQTTTPERKWLFIAAFPMAIDVGLELFGIWNNTHLSRFATGALLGGVAILYVMPGLMDLALRNWSKSRKASTKPTTMSAVPSDLFASEVRTAPSDYSAPHRRI